MYSTLLYSYSNIKKTIFYISILLVFGCDNQMTSPVLVSPKHFKVQTPFMLDDRGIIINTYWGTEKKHYVLCLDNFSPSWIKRNLDSFKEISQSEIFPAIFDQRSIGVKVRFGNDNVEKMHIDLGYNGYMLLPSRDFKSISKKSRTYVISDKFNTPAQQNFVNNLSVVDTVAISHNFFVTQVSSNEKVQERLIVLSFFKRFDYVIFNFINERIYIPKKVW